MNSSLFPLILQSISSIWQAIKRSLRQLTKPGNHSLALNVALDITRPKSELVLENALLRQQLSVLQRQIQRPKLSWRDRALIILLASKSRPWKQAPVIVQPSQIWLKFHEHLALLLLGGPGYVLIVTPDSLKAPPGWEPCYCLNLSSV